MTSALIPGTKEHYVSEIDRYAGPLPFKDAAGNRVNLKAGPSLHHGAVKTDGAGNVIDMPLVTGKPCFGRPERFIRGAEDQAVPPFTGRNNTPKLRKTRCERCNLVNECAELVTERLDSAPAAGAAYIEWDELARDLPPLRKFKGKECNCLWLRFQASLKAHGGWSNCNDFNVHVDRIARSEASKRAAAAHKRKKRSEERDARMLASCTLAAATITALSLERDHRRDLLLRLRANDRSPAFLRKMTDVTCERTADVWWAKAVLLTKNLPVNGPAIAEMLINHQRCWNLSPTSMLSRISEALRRLKRLEQHEASAAIWPAFTPYLRPRKISVQAN